MFDFVQRVFVHLRRPHKGWSEAFSSGAVQSGAFPVVEIEPRHNTNQVLGYNYRFWHEMFNARQLLCLSILAERIRKVPETELRELYHNHGRQSQPDHAPPHVGIVVMSKKKESRRVVLNVSAPNDTTSASGLNAPTLSMAFSSPYALHCHVQLLAPRGVVGSRRHRVVDVDPLPLALSCLGPTPGEVGMGASARPWRARSSVYFLRSTLSMRQHIFHIHQCCLHAVPKPLLQNHQPQRLWCRNVFPPLSPRLS